MDEQELRQALHDDPVALMEYIERRSPEPTHHSDRSKVHTWEENGGRWVFKRMDAYTREVRWNRAEKDAPEKLRQRVRNAVENSRWAYERGVPSDHAWYVDHELKERYAYMLFRPIEDGLFLDDYLLDGMPNGPDVNDMIRGLAHTITLVHGRRGERGRLHGDLNTKNIFVHKNGTIRLIDWESWNTELGDMELNDRQRQSDLALLISQEQNRYSRTRFPNQHFGTLWRAYHALIDEAATQASERHALKPA